MILVCYKCGHFKEMNEEEFMDICLDKKSFFCSNDKCDSWQFFKENDSIEVVGERILKCKKCGSTNFTPCGDGDGINLTLEQWKCECGNYIWVYSKYDSEEIIKLKAQRKNLEVYNAK